MNETTITTKPYQFIAENDHGVIWAEDDEQAYEIACRHFVLPVIVVPIDLHQPPSGTPLSVNYAAIIEIGGERYYRYHGTCWRHVRFNAELSLDLHGIDPSEIVVIR